MKVRSGLAFGVVLTLGLAVGVAPAQAVPGVPTVSNVVSSTAGHVTGTVSAPGAAYVEIGLNPVGAHATPVPMSGGTGSFDVVTWGHAGSTNLYVLACDDPSNSATCTTRTVAATFTPTDVTPMVTWSTDSTIGPNESATVTVDDPGGGMLVARDLAAGSSSAAQTDPHGTTTLNLSDGSHNVEIERCPTDESPSGCVSFATPQVHAFEVKQSINFAWPDMAAITATRSSTQLTVDTDVTGNYDITWHIVDSNGQTVPGSSGAVTDQQLSTSGTLAPITIEGAALPDSPYHYLVAAVIVVRDPDWGTFTENVTSRGPLHIGTDGAPQFLVDRTAPVTSATVTPALIYPHINQPSRPGVARIDLTYQADIAGVTITSGSTLVRTLATAYESGMMTARWNGKDSSGNIVPAGVYDIRAFDGAGNKTAVIAQVTVSDLRRVQYRFTAILSAQSSLLAKYVGRCSTLRKPSLHRWSGSLGFYSGTRCKTRSWDASAASTVHGVHLPAYGGITDLHVYTYGGAARTRNRSIGWIRFLNYTKRWGGDHAMDPNVASHDTDLIRPDLYIQKNGDFLWGFYTHGASRYDVAYFKVVFDYYIDR